MKYFFDSALQKFFQNQPDQFANEISEALNKSNEIEKAAVKEKYSGGNFITAQFKLHISRATFFRYIKKFRLKLQRLILLKINSNL